MPQCATSDTQRLIRAFFAPLAPHNVHISSNLNSSGRRGSEQLVGLICVFLCQVGHGHARYAVTRTMTRCEARSTSNFSTWAYWAALREAAGTNMAW